ncbi:MAG: hypothetical protein H0U85_03690 [Gemmatimonadales bacterium]|nr:hypothetical protein [Gemmatimonadales bacterium]
MFFGSLYGTAVFLATLVAGIGGYLISRSFVRQRLRFVDAAQSPVAPLLAGVIAFAVAWPLTLLPIVTISAAVTFGLGCGFGTASGARALRRGEVVGRRLNP